MFNPRGSIVCPSRPVDLGGGLMVAGRKPGIIVYIKAGSGKLTREFHRFCSRTGVDALPIQQRVEDDRDEAFECVGTVESLERLIGHPSVARWHYIVNARPPMSAGGGGELTDRARKALRRARMRWADREALEETERRAKLSTAERELIELAEAVERERALNS